MVKKPVTEEMKESAKGRTPDVSTVVVQPVPRPAVKKEVRAAMPGDGMPDVTRQVKTKGGDYPVYKKTSTNASTFRSAFASARKAGKSSFDYAGRKYSTKVK